MTDHNENINNLLQLIKDNPGLKIVPMVDSECIHGDDYGIWMARWGDSKVDEYYLDDEKIYCKSTCYEDVVEKFLNDNEEITEEQAEKMADEVEWIKAIIVNIEPS